MSVEDSQCSVRDFLDTLVRRLESLREDKKYFTWTVNCPDSRYVQFLVQPDGAIIAEVMSNLHGMDWALSSDDEDELRAMEFREPAYGPLPNWWQEYRTADNLHELLEKIERVMFVVFKEQPWEMVESRQTKFKVAKGQILEDYLLEKRAYSVLLNDPKEVSRFLRELDDREALSNWLSDE